MASQRSLVALFVLCLLCGNSLVLAKRRYLSVNMDNLLDSKAHVTIPAACGLPPNCRLPPGCDSDGNSIGRDVFNHDIRRLSTLLQRSSDTQGSADSLAGPVPAITLPPLPWPLPRPPTSPPVAPPAEAPSCSAAAGRCSGTYCRYRVQYGDGSSSSGVLSRDTLTLTTSRTLPNFAFGCGQNNLGSFGKVDGLIGLGRGELSLASQAAASSLGATFSYCLPSSDKSHGYLTIGSTPVTGKVQYTAMIQKPEYPSFYFVELVSIDIGGYVLPVPPTVFTSTGTLLDSGTILTYLPKQAYTSLRDRFKFTMKGYKPAPAYDILETCYDFTGQSAIIIPAVSFKFSDGAVFDLDFFGVLVFPEKPTIGCLAFVPRPSMMPFTIFGNIQQRSAEVIYDVAAEKIGCSGVALVAAGHQERNFKVVPTASFLSSQASCYPTPRAASHGHSSRALMPLAHRHGPCSPVQSKEDVSLAETLRRDLARTKYITRRASRNKQRLQSTDAVSVPTQLGSAFDSQQYVVTVGFGSPAVPQTLLVDTGSDLTWIQCKACNSSSSKCYPQRHPLFDPSSSSTYTPVPCDSQSCRTLAAGIDGNGCNNSNSECSYQITYGSRANTTGVYSTDALTLAPGAVVESFHFGCGNDQHGPFDKIDGILGLGRLPESLAWQAPSSGGVFSHCLPPTGSATTGFLALGAPANTSGFAFTPMLTMDEQPWFYQLMLTGISVGGRALDIPAAVFSEGMITDSGTVITALQETAYAAVRAAFRSAMAGYPLAPPVGHLDTCYNFTGFDNVTVPTVSLTFRGGATVDLDAASGVMLDGCLAFWGSGGDNYTGVIGNVNQRTIEVLYDMPGARVGFRPNAC
ncbi:hypothetical protein EJB05_45123, partial [Eragrostis curvula]